MRRPDREYDGGVKSPGAKPRMTAWVLGLAGLCALVVAIYFAGVLPNTRPKNFGIVDDGKVYRSGALTPAATEKVVATYHVKTIIDLGGFDKDPVGERVAAQTAAALGVERRVFPLEGDGTGNPNAYVEALRVMSDPSKQPVLVHCSAGAQRTSGAVMLYRDFVQGKPLDQTYDEAREFKHDPKDNPRLMPYLKQWRDKIGEAFKSGGLIQGQAPPSGSATSGAAGDAGAGDR